MERSVEVLAIILFGVFGLSHLLHPKGSGRPYWLWSLRWVADQQQHSGGEDQQRYNGVGFPRALREGNCATSKVFLHYLR
jgi:hypothetical protein